MCLSTDDYDIKEGVVPLKMSVNDPSGHPTPPSGGANGGGGGNNNVGGDGCATVAPIALAAVVLMVITPML
ncbi:hypothetical protein LSM04_008514 [Trypanosoma melophagium]|uniref:uncharacterized protein n=1 Tax=Trypanosoma melophagium TaxID=715481 RepID=UPI00351A14FA|nr:hypothetical protein LSM04_007849 [Trypanosoma melophagium]KAH9584004.1 hypothetical protein LSM04_008514 [Trypanosoma melophagium]